LIGVAPCSRGALRSARAAAKASALKTSAAKTSAPLAAPRSYNSTYGERFERFKGRGGLGSIDVEGVKDLLDKSGGGRVRALAIAFLGGEGLGVRFGAGPWRGPGCGCGVQRLRTRNCYGWILQPSAPAAPQASWEV
jgi:hypothetical protein